MMLPFPSEVVWDRESGRGERPEKGVRQFTNLLLYSEEWRCEQNGHLFSGSKEFLDRLRGRPWEEVGVLSHLRKCGQVPPHLQDLG